MSIFNVWRALTAAVPTVVVALSGGTSTASEPRILAFGDSLVAGYGLQKTDSFPSRLERALREAGHAVTVVGAGVSGETTAGGRTRLGWLLEEKFDVVLLELGANDGLRGLEPQQTRQNLEAMIVEAQASGARVLLAGMLAPPNLGREYAEAFNAVFPALAEEHDLVFYPFFLDGVAMQPEYNLGDGIHPNAAGVARIVERILPFVERTLRGVGS